MKTILIIAGFLLATGCCIQAQSGNNDAERVSIAYGVDKFTDQEEGVVCYVYISNAISCVKRSKK